MVAVPLGVQVDGEVVRAAATEADVTVALEHDLPKPKPMRRVPAMQPLPASAVRVVAISLLRGVLRTATNAERYELPATARSARLELRHQPVSFASVFRRALGRGSRGRAKVMDAPPLRLVGRGRLGRCASGRAPGSPRL